MTLAAAALASPLSADERFRLRLEESIRDVLDRYPSGADPRDTLLHAVVELARPGSDYDRGVRLIAIGACLETIGLEIQKIAEPLLERAARAEGVEG